MEASRDGVVERNGVPLLAWEHEMLEGIDNSRKTRMKYTFLGLAAYAAFQLAVPNLVNYNYVMRLTEAGANRAQIEHLAQTNIPVPNSIFSRPGRELAYKMLEK